MVDLEWWKLGADLMLLGGLAWLSFCLVRSRSGVGMPSRQGVELERTLRGLIKEADLASSSLHDQLLRRQQSLERTLRDLESTEQRITRTAQAAESRVVTNTPAAAGADQPVAAPPRRELRQFEGPEAPSFNRVATPSKPSGKPPSMRPQTNIYGEPIETTAAAPVVAAAQTPLTAAIEREVIPSQQTVHTAPERGAESLREVRRAAEELLRAGRDLEFVARRTNLTIDEVRLLSNAVLRESARRTSPVESTIVEKKTEADPAMLGADPRLGALSPIRRSIETV